MPIPFIPVHSLAPSAPVRVLRHPLTRLILLPLALLPVAAVNLGVSILVLDRLPAPLAKHQIVFQSVVIVALLALIYQRFCKGAERRQVLEFSWNGALKEFLVGAAIAAGWVSTFVLLLTASGSYRISGVSSAATLMDATFLFAMGSFAQELFFSLIVLRLLEEWLGSRLALGLSVAVFVAAHVLNPNQSVLSFLGLAAVGTTFMAAFMWTRRLWLAWGLHFAWNLLQAGVFGMPNSGHSFKGLLRPVISGPTWLTGGAFGFEASILTILFLTVLTVLFMQRASLHGQLLAPRWKR